MYFCILWLTPVGRMGVIQRLREHILAKKRVQTLNSRRAWVALFEGMKPDDFGVSSYICCLPLGTIIKTSFACSAVPAAAIEQLLSRRHRVPASAVTARSSHSLSHCATFVGELCCRGGINTPSRSAWTFFFAPVHFHHQIPTT